MEKWDHKSLRDHQKRHNCRENPSFSSTLLDAIYRSIDEGKTEQKQQDHLVSYRDTMSTRKQKQSSNFFRHYDDDGGVVVETKAPNFRRNSLTEFDRRRTRSSSNSFSIFSSSSSSESSSGYGFSSSESESLYKMQKLKPIRTSVSFSSSIPPQNSNFEALNTYRTHSAQTQKPSHEKNGFAGKTKSKAFKILYGDLKKTKQPISPGARLAGFLNSLFNSSGNAKKSKVANSHESKPPQSSNCSSASSFSRSCLSKTPSSRSGGAKRSVRFCPVSVIVDEDCRPCGQKNILQEEEKQRGNEELRFHVMKESRRVEEFARELFKKKKKKKKEGEFDMNYEDEEDDDDDGVSCASSDLFELDNLSGIGIERYREELPVYETTHFDTNRAIANGFIL